MIETSDVELITVCYKSSYEMQFNLRLVNALNKSSNYKWIVACNDGDESIRSYLRPGRDIVFMPECKDFGDGEKNSASTHHGLALNEAFLKSSARYVVVMDPDFFVIQKEWISSLIERCRVNNYSFFGATWSPFAYEKYRYFPCVHFMLIDTFRVRKETLDFTPSKRSRIKEMIRSTASRILPEGIRYITRVGSSRDTGHKIYRRYRSCANHLVGTLDYGIARGGVESSILAPRAKLLRGSFIERFYRLPIVTSALTDISPLSLMWLTMATVENSEVFMKNDQIYAFHLRRHGKLVGAFKGVKPGGIFDEKS